MGKVELIETIDELGGYIERNEPCVYRMPQESLLSCQRKWSKDYLAKTVGDNVVAVRNSRSKKYVDPSQGFLKLVQAMLVYNMTIDEFLKAGVEQGLVMSGTETYLFHQGVVVPAWQELWEDAKAVIAADGLTGVGGFLPADRLHTVGLWVSGAGIKSILHYDDSGNHNLNLQIRGSKRIVLFPPSDWPKLKTFAAVSLHDMNVYADLIDHPNLQGQPVKLAGTHPVSVELHENDVLYIPSHWYHYVKHEGDFNVNMTCWFEPAAGEASSFAIPKRSCAVGFVIAKMVAAFAVSGAINFSRKITGARMPRLLQTETDLEYKGTDR